MEENIVAGRTSLGIEFGSTRIKAVLSDFSGKVLASGFYEWENSYVDGIWTYSLEDIHKGLKGCYSSLKKDVKEKYSVSLTKVGAIGISAMMHGYMVFDEGGEILSPFQTWRNRNTEEAAKELTELFQFNIPLRWSIAHLYQRILDKEEHVKRIAFMNTLSSYVHWRLTGERVIGIGDAAGMFPIDNECGDYNQEMMGKFEGCIKEHGFSISLKKILPCVKVAGDCAGYLTKEGAAFLDEDGELEEGVVFCAPEGDAGTGMVATNAIAVKTGNVSAGTSIFAMIVLEKELSRLYKEMDIVATPDGLPVAMAHGNNGTTEINSWINIFMEFAELMDMKVKEEEVFSALYEHSLKGDKDCGGILSYGYHSGEGVVSLNEGRPLMVRYPDSGFNLANFMRAKLYSALGPVKIGLDILLKEEGVEVNRIMAHGGLFKTKGVAQSYMAAAVNAPVTVMETAGEGGAWGISLLALYMICKDGLSLSEFLEKKIFVSVKGEEMKPDQRDVEGFEAFMERYRKGLDLERAAIEILD